MTINKNVITEFANKIEDLYGSIIIDEEREEYGFMGQIDEESRFFLDDQGYRSHYLSILKAVFQLPGIGDKWSTEGIEELGYNLLHELAITKKKESVGLDFEKIADDWLSKIDIEFQDHTSYIIVSGLRIDTTLEIGDVKFVPLDTDIPEFDDFLAKNIIDKANSYKDCIAYSTVNAEWRRASEIHQQKTEEALNIIRYIASLIWHDQSSRLVNVSGRDIKHIGWSFVSSSDGVVGSKSLSEFTVLPVTLTQEYLPYAKAYGLNFIQDLLNKTSLSELEQSFLTAIQWYGQATQEVLPLVAFVKYYISIETALKKNGEHAKTVLPRRLGVLIESWDKLGLEKLEDDLCELIDERNEVFHSGKPLRVAPEELHWEAKILSRQALNRLRKHIDSDGWQTKDDLIAWVKNQYDQFINR